MLLSYADGATDRPAHAVGFPAGVLLGDDLADAAVWFDADQRWHLLSMVAATA